MVCVDCGASLAWLLPYRVPSNGADQEGDAIILAGVLAMVVSAHVHPLNAFSVLPGLAAAEQLRPGSRDCDACTCKRQYQPHQSKRHDNIRTLHQASSWLPITSNSTLAAAAEDVG